MAALAGTGEVKFANLNSNPLTAGVVRVILYGVELIADETAPDGGEGMVVFERVLVEGKLN